MTRHDSGLHGLYAQVPDKYARLYQPYGKLEKASRRSGMISALDEAVSEFCKFIYSSLS